MDIKLSEYGWSGLADCSIDLQNNLNFISAGYIYNKNTLRDNKHSTRVESDFLYNGLDIGLLLWYNQNIGHIIFSINKEEITIKRSLYDNEIFLSRVPLDDIVNLEIGDIVNLKCDLNRTNIKGYINNVEVINIEENTFTSGSFGVYGGVNESCIKFSLSTNTLDEWDIHVENGSVVNRFGEYIEIIIQNPLKPFSYISQSIPTELNTEYTISFNHSGYARLEIHNESSILYSYDTYSYENTRKEFTFNSNNNENIELRVGSSQEGTHRISLPQLESKNFATSFTENTRDASLLTFPAKDIETELGSLSLWISPIKDLLDQTSIEQIPIFYYNDLFKLNYDPSGILVFTYGLTSTEIIHSLSVNKKYHITCLWNSNKIKMFLLDEETLLTDEVLGISAQNIPRSPIFYIASNVDLAANIMVDNLVICKGHVDEIELLSYKYMESLNYENVVLSVNFEKETLVYDKNSIFIPVSEPSSPIVIKSNETTYERVYFIDNNRYVIYNKSEFLYNGNKTFKLLYKNILRVTARTETFDKIFHDITVNQDYITINDLAEDDTDKIIIVTYVVKDTFCVNYNSSFNQYEINLSNTDGEALFIYQEEPGGRSTGLIKTVELNPFKSVNNNGFIYVEDTPRNLEVFDIKITPDSLVANGREIATITVNCLSVGGIPTSNVDLEIVSLRQYGNITKYMTREEQEWIDFANKEGEDIAIERLGYFITDEHRSGTFIYKYEVGKFIRSQENESELIDQVIIRDNISGIGVQIPIRIVRELL